MKKGILLLISCLIFGLSARADESVTGVTITSQDTLKKIVGDTDVTLTWTVNPGNATNNNVSWSSTVETVATVTNAGVVSFLGAGETKIIVKTEDGDFKDTCIVQVKPVLATKIEFVKDTVYVQLGDSVALKVNVTPNNTTDKGANWKSLTPTIATVSDTGLVIAKSVGKVSIVAISKSVSTLTDTCIVYVTESQIPVKSVTLDNDSVNLIKDDTFQLIAEVSPANASNKKVNWTSKAPAIASVSSNGLVTAKETGKTLIYAITDDGGFKDSCIVVVRERVIFTNPEDATSRSGKFPISLNVPDDEILTGSFIVKFPIGFELDKTNTKLAGTFETASYLSIKDGESNSWVIEIKDKADLKNMLRATTSKMKVLDIAYTINQSVINGTYNINITDAIFKFSDNSEIKEEKMTVKLKVNIDPNSNDLIESEKVYAYSTNNRLYVQSEEAETISVYSFNGTLLYSKEKPVGEIILDVNIQEPIVIVKGSSGWSQKVTK